MGISTGNSQHIPIQDWIKNFLNFFRKKKEDGEEMALKFISIMWSIWLHRNEIIFNNIHTSPGRIIELQRICYDRAMKSAQRSQEDQMSEICNVEAKERIEEKYWELGDRTTNRVQILAVDGAWKKKHKSGQWQAAVAWKNLSHSQGEEFATRVFASTPLQTEAYAVLQATKDMEWKCSDISIKTDNQEVIRALHHQGKADKSITSIISEIKQRARSFQYFSCQKVKREDVSIAHNLARKARLGTYLS